MPWELLGLPLGQDRVAEPLTCHCCCRHVVFHQGQPDPRQQTFPLQILQLQDLDLASGWNRWILGSQYFKKGSLATVQNVMESRNGLCWKGP